MDLPLHGCVAVVGVVWLVVLGRVLASPLGEALGFLVGGGPHTEGLTLALGLHAPQNAGLCPG